MSSSAAKPTAGQVVVGLIGKHFGLDRSMQKVEILLNGVWTLCPIANTQIKQDTEIEFTLAPGAVHCIAGLEGVLMV